MAKLALHQGFYEARSPIANAQLCFNLTPEQNSPDAPFPVTMYPAPGTQILSDYTGTIGGSVRGLYVSSANDTVGVIGQTAFLWGGPGNNTATILGALPTNNGLPVSICDNGQTIVFVDGTSWGGMCPINPPANSLTQIVDPAFYGANRVDFIDTFLIFNQPGTGNFYTTTSNVVTPFDPLYFAAKEGWNDRLVSIAALHDNIWLFGNTTAEIWFNAGGTAFPFARMPNSVLQQGCIGSYTVVVADNAVYWISQDRWGRNMAMRGEGYAARRISTFAVEDVWAQYPNLAGSIGMAYQLGGHETVGWYFPTANAWWAYDAATQLWHQRTFDGLTQAWLPFCMAGLGNVSNVGYNNLTLAGDRTGPRILGVFRDTYTDAFDTTTGTGAPITRQRSWPHQQEDGQRIQYTRFAMSMTGAAMSPDTVNLDWSDDAGLTYGSPVPQTINNATNGQYLWRRLGYGRDRVYRATWSGNGEFALNGAYSDGIPEAT